MSNKESDVIMEIGKMCKRYWNGYISLVGRGTLFGQPCNFEIIMRNNHKLNDR